MRKIFVNNHIPDHSRSPNYIPSPELLADLAEVTTKLRKRRVSQTDYSEHGRYSFITICRRFRSWREALELVCSQPAHWRNVSAQALLDDLRRVAGTSTRLTVQEYLAKGLYSRKIVERHFDRWQTAVAAAGLKPGNPRKVMPRSRGPRTISVALRYRTILHDKFRCTACGRSPATEAGVQLEVDHIVPWDHGGATRMENLRTLCLKCKRCIQVTTGSCVEQKMAEVI